MYSEIEIINKITNKESIVHITLQFIKEYSGWLQHLNEVGGIWGAAGETIGAYKESIKCKAHIERLEQIIINCTRRQRTQKKILNKGNYFNENDIYNTGKSIKIYWY